MYAERAAFPSRPRLGVDSRRRVRLALTVEAVPVGVSAAVAFVRPDTHGTRYALIAVTAHALGLRSAAVRTLRAAGLATTVLTMTVTALTAGFPPGPASPTRRATAPRAAGTQPAVTRSSFTPLIQAERSRRGASPVRRRPGIVSATALKMRSISRTARDLPRQ